MSRIRVSTLAFILTISAAYAVFAQSADTASNENNVFAPYVSRLRVAVKDPVVMLTWDDPAGVPGTVNIYRSSVEINTSTFSSATLVGTVTEGTGSFVDVPASPGKYYYAVLVDSPSAGLYKVFVPFRDMTIEPISIASAATAKELAANVSGISAVVDRETVNVSFKVARAGRTLDVYRATTPIDNPSTLKDAVLIRQITSGTSTVADYPVPGVPYYYAVIDSQVLQSGEAAFEAGKNATARPVEVPLGVVKIGIPASNAPAPRSTPLPYLMLSQDLQTGAELAPSLTSPAPPTTLGSKTKAAVSSLVNGIHVAPLAVPSPAVLPSDRAAADRGESYTLKSIVDTAFDRKDWSEAQHLLQNLLTVPLSDDVQARAQFYLGQCYYFQGLYRQAFVAFLLARDAYYADVTPWINSILDNDL